MQTLDDETMFRRIARRDSDLRRVLCEYGIPSQWKRSPSFGTLVHIILEQQVSLSSAKATFMKLKAASARLTPAKFLEFDDARLKSFGFSRQKTRYCRELANAIIGKKLNLRQMAELPDGDVREALTAIVGIGNWTVDIYLLMVLRRTDVWPAGDMALAVAVKEVKQLEERPTPDELIEIAEPWRPLRSGAARLLWHYYLSRGKK